LTDSRGPRDCGGTPHYYLPTQLSVATYAPASPDFVLILADVYF
jgi:hypothetical protein